MAVGFAIVITLEQIQVAHKFIMAANRTNTLAAVARGDSESPFENFAIDFPDGSLKAAVDPLSEPIDSEISGTRKNVNGIDESSRIVKQSLDTGGNSADRFRRLSFLD